LQIGPNAATAVGFVTRTDMERTSGKGQYTLRPSVLGLRRVDLYVGGKYLTRVDNEPQDGNGFAGFSFETNSGETLAVTEVLGFTVLDYGFALADRIPIAAGRSDLRDTEVSVTTSAKRPVWGYTQVSLLDIWNGRLSTVGGGLQVRGGSRLSLAATYTRSEATMPAGAFVAHVPGLRLGWTQTTRLTVATYLQYNSLTRRFIGNFRLDFIHHPGSDLFVVFNEERGTEAEPWSLVDRGFAVKLNYLIRF
jgi:hypothetical protein